MDRVIAGMKIIGIYHAANGQRIQRSIMVVFMTNEGQGKYPCTKQQKEKKIHNIQLLKIW